MDTNLLRSIDSFSGLRVLVIGDAMLDSYLRGTAERICREAPVPIVALNERVDMPGAAANTAMNLRALGADVVLLAVIGDDAEGALLLHRLLAAGVATEYMHQHPQRRTLSKNRVIAGSQTLVRFDQGSAAPLDQPTEQALITQLVALFPDCDAVIVSDYGYGVMTAPVIAALAALQAQHPRTLVVDSKQLPAYRHVEVTAVKPNYGETCRLLEEHGLEHAADRAEVLVAHGAALLERTGAQIVAATLDVDGALVFERGSTPYRTYAQPADHTRAAGAGDTYISALTLALAAGAETTAAAELAAAAAAVVVARDGTTLCSAAALRAQVAAGAKYLSDRAELAVLAATYRAQGRRIVFTNGCFDILHRGHVTYLSQAKALGDVLIVGVNTDSSIGRLKGPSRPINDLDDRVHVLAALSCIDHLIAFDEDTPFELIRAVQPDIFVKGGDYTRRTLPEAALVEALGGEVHILPFLPDRSTTGLIARMHGLERALGDPNPALR